MRLVHVAVLGAAAAVLAAVFLAHLDPHMVVDLATRIWACL